MTRSFGWSVKLLAAVALFVAATPVQAQDEKLHDGKALEFFEKRIRPILVEHCYECHSGQSTKVQAGLRLDHRKWLEAGGDSGAVITPGDSHNSLLMQAVRYESFEMPPNSRLAPDQIDALAQWIDQGATWPDEPLPEEASSTTAFDWESRRKEHWAWQPIQTPTVPHPHPDTFSRLPLDRFVFQKAVDRVRIPNLEADRSVLLRRVYLDLIGIPPTPAQLHEDLKHRGPDWYEKVVDRLLASPQFGVRFGRHWLDLVRYAESRGHEFDEDSPGARHYRDYVVRALNADVPYDQFVTEHIAGDLLDPPRTNPDGWNESVLGTGFWFLGEWVHSPVDSRKDETDRFDNMVDVFAKTFQGLTIACARCHDHKFDAIATSDYYALYGFLRSSHFRLARFESELNHRQQAETLRQTRAKYVPQMTGLLQSIAESEGKDPQRAARWNRWLEGWPLLDSKSTSIAIPLPDDSPEIRVQFQGEQARMRSDGVAYGTIDTHCGVPELHWWKPQKQVRFALWSGAKFDPFWSRMESVEPSTNRQNRYVQLQEAGKTLATDTFLMESNQLSYLIRGNVRAFVEVDSMRLISGPLHGEVLQDFRSEDPSQFRWVQHRLDRYQGKRVRLEFAPLDDLGMEIVQIADGEVRPSVASPARQWLPDQPDAATIAGRWNAIARWLEAQSARDTKHELANLDEFCIASLVEHLVRRLESMLIEKENESGSEKLATWNKLLAAWEQEERAISDQVRWKSRVAMGMADGNGENDVLLIRGNPTNAGPIVARRYLQALQETSQDMELAPSNRSGRLELARCLTHPANPLTARVMVNRLWHHLIGRGIVPTTDDFGYLGQRPTHPELLDHLASKFRDEGWSIKRMVRMMVCSSTYRMSSERRETDKDIDPENLWLTRARVRRLEGEAIRDSLLAVCGRLDVTLQGDSVPVHLTDFLQGRGRPAMSGPLDSFGRRSLYIAIRRNFLPPMLTVFDMPTPFSSMGRRNVSNVPAQSLALLNDPLVHELARDWGARLAEEPDSLERRIQQMYETALGREATGPELTLSLRFLEEAENREEHIAAWQQLVHALLNSKEMIYRF